MAKKINMILGNAVMDNNGNLGCIALTISSLYLLDNLLKEKNVDYSIYLCDSHIPGVDVSVLDCVDRQITYGYCDNIYFPKTITKIKHLIKMLIGKKEPHFIQMRFDTKDNMRKSRDLFNNADVFFDIGQGDSFADIYGKARFESIDCVHVLARKLKKPYCLLPQTIGPISNKSIMKKAIKSLACADLVMARDKQSFDYVKELVPNQKNIGEYVDVAFYLPYKRTEFEKDFIHVGLNISGLLWHGGYTGKNELGLFVNYQRLIRKIIECFLEIPNVKMHIIPHVRSKEIANDNDYLISQKLVNDYSNSRIVLAGYFKGPIEAKNYISGMDFFMGARMHSTIAAFSSNTPVIPMAYSRKFNGLFLDTLHYPYMVDLKADSEEKILEIIRKSFDKREKLKAIEVEQMASTVVEARRKFEKDFSAFLKI